MIEAQRFAQILRLHEGREAGAQVHGITRRRRQQLAIAPDAGRSIGDGVAGDPFPDGLEVVGDLERSKTVLADIGGLEVTESPALSTSQPLHRFLLDAWSPPPYPPPRAGEGNKKSPVGGAVMSVTMSSSKLASGGLSTLPGSPVGWQASSGRPLCHS